MITFTLSLIALIVGYFVYGRFVERVFGPDDRPTPATTMADGVDYIALPPWKIFMIQFLNIAGVGPIFGAIMGSMYGTSAYIWIVVGCIFAGAVHDYLSGMYSLRQKGSSMPEVVGRSLGLRVRQLMRVFMVVLLLLCGAVWVDSPSQLLAMLTPDAMGEWFWIIVIFVYYIVATLLPIDKIIGRIYPLFAAALLFMAVGIMVMLFVHHPDIPEVWETLANTHPRAASNPVFPMLFVTLTCGAISGFHATQSPLMARCMTSERQGRPIFYGAMIAEGIVALVWATVGIHFFQQNGGEGAVASEIVFKISNDWLGSVGGVLAMLGVIVAPITSGDTAFRSARLIVADFLHLDQRSVGKRLAISIPMFVLAAGILAYSISDENGFEIIWRYFSLSNQSIACIVLWALTVYLARDRRKLYFLITLPAALFMSAVCVTYLFIAPEGFAMSAEHAPAIGAIVAAVCAALFFVWLAKEKKKETNKM